jgi:hypothetical protein
MLDCGVRALRAGLVLTVLLGLWLAPGPPAAWSQASQPGFAPAPGSILAPAGRQAAWLDLDAPRPRPVSRLQPPAYVADVAGSSTGAVALAVVAPLSSGGNPATIGGDLLSLDLTTGAASPLVMRANADESLGGPIWRADGTALLFQREDVRGVPISYPGQASVRYPARIEVAQPDGTARRALVDDARQPAPSPDGSRLAYVRPSARGTALLVRGLDGSHPERELVPETLSPDLAYPRFSPAGDQIAFMAAVSFVGGAAGSPLAFGLLSAGVAYAHGLPWDVWLVNVDGSGLRRLAELGADDGSVVWSPDGSQVFVYSGSGSSIVDVASGEVARYPYLAGYGATAWLP